MSPRATIVAALGTLFLSSCAAQAPSRRAIAEPVAAAGGVFWTTTVPR